MVLAPTRRRSFVVPVAALAGRVTLFLVPLALWRQHHFVRPVLFVSERRKPLKTRAQLWWTRSERFRTLGRLLVDVGISDPFVIPIYQVIAGVSGATSDRGARVSRIAKHFAVDHHTAAKALRWFRSR